MRPKRHVSRKEELGGEERGGSRGEGEEERGNRGRGNRGRGIGEERYVVEQVGFERDDGSQTTQHVSNKTERAKVELPGSWVARRER